MRRRDFIKFVAGSAAVWPLAADGQQPVLPVIGFVNGASPVGYAPYVTAFHQGLKEAGYVEGQNATIEYRWAEGQYDQLPALAADLVRRNVAGDCRDEHAGLGVMSTPPSKKSGSVKFTQWRLPHQFQPASGLSRAPELSHCSLH
jgi:hypothetical protein